MRIYADTPTGPTTTPLAIQRAILAVAACALILAGLAAWLDASTPTHPTRDCRDSARIYEVYPYLWRCPTAP